MAGLGWHILPHVLHIHKTKDQQCIFVKWNSLWCYVSRYANDHNHPDRCCPFSPSACNETKAWIEKLRQRENVLSSNIQRDRNCFIHSKGWHLLCRYAFITLEFYEALWWNYVFNFAYFHLSDVPRDCKFTLYSRGQVDRRLCEATPASILYFPKAYNLIRKRSASSRVDINQCPRRGLF